MTTLKPSYRPYRPRISNRKRAAATASLPADGGTCTRAAELFTVGLEEEMFLAHARGLDCVSEMPEPFLREAKLHLGDRVKREIIASMIEICTAPHHSLEAAGEELRVLRARLGEIAARHGLALLASGTHPFADWRSQTLTRKPRYDAVAGSLGTLSRRVHVCGLHVHVALPEPALRIEVMNRAQGYLPLLLALSTSSPFWRGATTGLKSYRSAAYDESPRTGLPIRFADAAEFDRFVAKMQSAGFIEDESYLWWAIRPSLKYPTLELRIADSCTDVRHSIAIAALYRCLVHALVYDGKLGAAWEDHHYLINEENRWQAIRYGLGGDMLDPGDGSKRTTMERVRTLVDALIPSALALGCLAELESVNEILERGTSAELQSQAYAAALASGACEETALHRVASDIAERTMAA